MALDRFNTKKYSTVIATIERSAGNESVGDMWTESRTYPLDATLKQVLDWAAIDCSGRLTLTMDKSSVVAEEGK